MTPADESENHLTEVRDQRVAAEAVTLSYTQVLRALGYKASCSTTAGDEDAGGGDREIPAHTADVVRSMIEKAESLLEPRYVWSLMGAELGDAEEITVSSTKMRVGKLIRSQLRGAEAVSLFVASIGSSLESEARAMMASGETLEGYVLDAVGSVAAEALADMMQAEVSEHVARQGWKITNRFSPGYCTWETGGQKALFSLLPDEPAGVTLTESCLMTPIKSVSGIIGLGENVKYQDYVCEFCSMTDCHQRLVDSRTSS